MGIIEKPIVKVIMLKGEKGEQGDVSLSQFNEEKNARISSDNNLQSQINGLTGGTPLSASSTNEMTDTTRIYVNTTDGKWYYYDGTQWTIGGTYQSTAIAENSINTNTLDSELQNAIFKEIGTNLDISNADIGHFIKHVNGYFTTSNNAYSLIVPIEPNTKYIVKKILSSKFALYTSENYPVANGTITNDVADDSKTQLEITSGADDHYLTIYYYSALYDTLTEEAIRTSIQVYKDVIKNTETQAEYLDNKIDNALLSEKYIKLLSTKQLGTLTKGYIAISCDDGANALADTTIDIFKGYKTTYNKNIPLTMGLMNNSQIFSDNTRKNKVLDLINNYGSSVAIHGVTKYTNYTQDELYEFLDTQKNYLTNNLVAPSSIIYPEHDYNELTSTIAGSYYGVACTGGQNNPITYDIDGEKLNGPRSNMYTLYRLSLFNSEMTTTKIKDAIDYAYDNNMILMPFFHDNTLANNYERNKELLDYCVDYANSKGLEFINIGDIPNIK